MVWETAVLEGGPADGVTVRVAERPLVLQITRRCQADEPVHDLVVDMVFVYRRKHAQPPLRYGYDPASP
ncbi:hypothetical protein ACFW3D_40125 [Streptomyces sp. NPDC058864]